MSSMRLVAGWIGWVALSLAAGQVGNLLGNAAARQVYQRLEPPSWAPPGVVFAPVWITLYVVMGTAAWLGNAHSPACCGCRTSRGSRSRRHSTLPSGG